MNLSFQPNIDSTKFAALPHNSVVLNADIYFLILDLFFLL